MNKFLFRAIGFSALMAILLAIFCWDTGGKWIFLVIAPAFAAMAVYEAAKMLDDAGRKNYPKWTAAIFYLAAICAAAYECYCCCCIQHRNVSPQYFALVALLTVILLLFAFLFLFSLTGCALLLLKKEELLTRLLNTEGILALLAVPLLFFLASFFYEKGGYFLLFLCLVTKATDTGGYIVGTLTGRRPRGNHKIAPNISPNKSWEGLIGGLALSVGVSALFYTLAPRPCFAWWSVLLCGVLLGLGSFFGDLAESALKRMCNIKDSGAWVPGMGGALDVLDSFLFNGTIFAILVLILGYK